MENFVVSARKYRPVTFKTVVGQSTIVKTLKNAIRTNSLAQAFLFTGPRGIGKTTCARILAKTINCLNIQEDTEPCNECESCRSFNKLASFNIQELDAASNNSVDDIRALVDQVRIPPQAGKYKVYIIDEVHMLSSNAFNAFLKTLEEPPSYAKFILATTERHKIMPTILSRCQIYDFKRISVTDIAKYLAWVAEQENITTEEEALHVIAQKADGALRDALSIFDQIVSFSGSNVSYSNVIENLNLLDYEYYFKVMESIVNLDIPSTLLVLNEIIDKGFDGHQFIIGLGDHIRNLLLSKDESVAKLMETGESVKERLYNQAKLFSMIYLVKALDLVSSADQQYRTSSNKRLHNELLLMQLCETARIEAEKKKPEIKSRNKDAVTSSGTEDSSKASPPATDKSLSKDISETKEIADKEKSQKSHDHINVPIAIENKKVNQKHFEEIVDKSASVRSSTGKSGKSLRIKDMIANSGTLDSDVEDDTELPGEPQGEVDPLDREMIQQIIKEYSAQISPECPSFAAAIIENPVEIGDDNLILIKFSNKAVADKEHLKKLRTFIKSKVNDTWFSLVSEIIKPVSVEKTVLGPKEKYLRMKKKTPNIETFIRKLNLEPDH